LKNITPLEFLIELERIKKCVDTNYYNIVELLIDNNNLNIDIQTQRHIRLTQLIHFDKFEKKFKTRATRAIQSKRESYEMLDFAKF
jgi:hypothetical protein